MAQIVVRLHLQEEAEVSAVSRQGQPRVQLMLPAARELAAKAPGRAEVGASEGSPVCTWDFHSNVPGRAAVGASEVSPVCMWDFHS